MRWYSILTELHPFSCSDRCPDVCSLFDPIANMNGRESRLIHVDLSIDDDVGDIKPQRKQKQFQLSFQFSFPF